MPTDSFAVTLEEWIKVSTHRSMRAFIHHARRSGLSMSHVGALIHIYHEGKCGVTELGNHLDVSSAAASQMLDRLVQQEYILRNEDPDDRRVKQIVLSEKGNQVLEEAMHARQSWLDELTKSLSDTEKETIKVSLEILIDKALCLEQPFDVKG